MTLAAHASPLEPEPRTRDFYVQALKTLDHARIPYLVGGGYAMAHYTSIARTTKDLDIFIRPRDSTRALHALAAAGYRTEYFYPFWIAKALQDDAFMDIIYNSANGLCPVDDDWFENAGEIDVHGHRTRLCPAEEQLWSKAFVQDRDRYDGADVIHLILRHGHHFDWQRLISRFACHERILLAHLILFGYAYPSERAIIPQWVLDRLADAVAAEAPAPGRICRGTNIAQQSYLVAVRQWGYADARLHPHGPLTPQELAQLLPPAEPL